jgi:hypothetical protein
MKVGDLVRHRHGTMQGAGIILSLHSRSQICTAMWTAHGQTKMHDVATQYLEVINESSTV